MSRLIFVYGTLLSTRQMAEVTLGSALEDCRATLPGWRLTFNRGLATIVTDPNSKVEGALYRVDDKGELKLDRYEGCSDAHPDRGLYRKRTVTVEAEDGSVDALVYEMNGTDGWFSPPSKSTLAMIVEGFSDWEIPFSSLSAAIHPPVSMP